MQFSCEELEKTLDPEDVKHVTPAQKEGRERESKTRKEERTSSCTYLW